MIYIKSELRMHYYDCLHCGNRVIYFIDEPEAQDGPTCDTCGDALIRSSINSSRPDNYLARKERTTTQNLDRLSWPRCHSRHEGARETGENCRPGLVYVAQYGDLYKIGSTVSPAGFKSVRKRIQALNSQTKLKFSFCFALQTNCGYGLERYLHSLFRREQLHPPLREKRLLRQIRNQFVNEHINSSEVFWLSGDQVYFLRSFSWFNGGTVRRIDTINRYVPDMSLSTFVRQNLNEL